MAAAPAFDSARARAPPSASPCFAMATFTEALTLRVCACASALMAFALLIRPFLLSPDLSCRSLSSPSRSSASPAPPPLMPTAVAVAVVLVSVSAAPPATPCLVAPSIATDTPIASAWAFAVAAIVPVFSISSRPPAPSMPVALAVAIDSARASAPPSATPFSAIAPFTEALTLRVCACASALMAFALLIRPFLLSPDLSGRSLSSRSRSSASPAPPRLMPTAVAGAVEAGRARRCDRLGARQSHSGHQALLRDGGDQGRARARDVRVRGDGDRSGVGNPVVVAAAADPGGFGSGDTGGIRRRKAEDGARPLQRARDVDGDTHPGGVGPPAPGHPAVVAALLSSCPAL